MYQSSGAVIAWSRMAFPPSTTGVPLLLHPGEKCFFAEPATLKRSKTARTFGGGSAGLSIPNRGPI